MNQIQQRLAIAVGQGDPHTAKILLQAVFDEARAAGNDVITAASLVHLAECNQLLGHSEQAYADSSLAAQMLREQGDSNGEAKALSALSRAANCLGLAESAIEASLLAVALSEAGDDIALKSDTLSQLGILLAYSGSFEDAHRNLESAEILARNADCVVDELVSIARQCSCETLRIINMRHETGEMPKETRISQLTSRVTEFRLKHGVSALSQADQKALVIFVDLAMGLFKIWSGEVDVGANIVSSTREWLVTTDQAPWMEGFACIAECETAQARADWQAAEAVADRMRSMTGVAYNQHQCAVLGHLLLSRCLAMQCMHKAALTVLQELATLQRSLRAASLQTRHEITVQRLELRRSDEERRRLMTSASELKRLSMQDSLTGIANRRHFEQEATAALQGINDSPGPSVCVALLDVDRFKQVNDGHSHVIGDKVLQTISALLTANVRDTDLAARLGGDEFVVLFRNANEVMAREACLRVATAVSSFDWSTLSLGLNVSVSIGLSAAMPGDTLETLTARSDMEMYSSKRALSQLACFSSTPTT